MKQSKDVLDTMLELLLTKINKERGLDFKEYRLACLRRRIDTRLRLLGIQNYNAYTVWLDHHPDEYEKLIDALTINVTEFFRDKDTWEFVQRNVIPEIIKNKINNKQKIINVWSAGSSGGEEAYTIAILFSEVLGLKLKEFKLRIYGTDIDKASLARANLGYYKPQSIINVPPNILRRYFSFDGKGYAICDEIKLLTKFKNQDLVLSEPIPSIDFIICRNVLIYFTRKLQEKILLKFYQTLLPNGFLLLGKTESLWTQMHTYFKTYFSGQRIYRKQSRLT